MEAWQERSGQVMGRLKKKMFGFRVALETK
jgi:hypothetical protein